MVLNVKVRYKFEVYNCWIRYWLNLLQLISKIVKKSLSIKVCIHIQSCDLRVKKFCRVKDYFEEKNVEVAYQ